MNLLQAIMNSQDMTKSEAITLINEMREEVYEGADPEELLYDLGLEPDYVMDLIG